MFSIKINVVYFISFIIIVRVEALDPLPVVEDNNIAITEAVIRNTVNSLFAPFNIKDIKRKPQIQQYSKIHNYFVSITLKDCENLKKIARLSTVNNIDNDTQNYITQINEVLNEGDKSDDVTTYIERFINKLRSLKEKYVSENNTDINKKILEILEDNQKSYKNATVNKTVANETDDLQNKNILGDNEFWQSGRRIFEGIRTKVKYFPFMASVHFFNTFQCAGSIIKNDLVITSASCLQIAWNNRFFRENPSFLAVRVGTNMYQYGGDYIPVLEIYFHPQYNPETLANNLAIMRLRRILVFRKSRKSIRKINIDKNPYPLDSSSGQITVIGWGARDGSNVVYDAYKNRLAYADLSLYPLSECRDHYSKVYVTDKNFCAGFFSKGSGACNHDAGGPGIWDSKLIGVISFGSPICGASDSPTVFTKVGCYTDWIESIFELEALTVYAPTTMQSPLPPRLPYYVYFSTKSSTKLLIKPENFPSVKLEDVLRAKTSNETFKDFIYTMFSGENDKSIADIEDPKEINIRTGQKNALTTGKAIPAENATAEWFIETTTPYAAASEPFEHVDDRLEGDNVLTTLPMILPIEDQNPKEISTEAPTTTTEITITTNTIKEETSSKHDNIMVLINNLDTEGTLYNETPEQNYSNEKYEITTKEAEIIVVPQNNIESENDTHSEKTLIEIEDDEYYDYDDDYDDDYNDDSNNDSEDVGMVIESGSVQDLTMRDNDNITDTENEQVAEAELIL